MKKISQAEARRLKKEVEMLKQQRSELVTDCTIGRPSGTFITSVKWNAESKVPVLIALARKLGFAVCVTTDGDETAFYAVKP